MAGPRRFDPSAFDPASPATFYLDDEELEELCDSIWVVEGRELPVHIGVVVTRSSVLRDAYRTEREAAAAQREAGVSTRKRARQAGEPPAGSKPRLTFDDCSLHDAAVFLRLMYHIEEATHANLAQLGDQLPALARLAHKYNVGALLTALESYLGAAPEDFSSPMQLITKLQLVDDLQLDGPLASLIQAVLLMAIGDGWVGPSDSAAAAGIQAAAQLQRLSPAITRSLLGALLAATRRLHASAWKELHDYLPNATTLAAWAQMQGATGQLVWDLQGLSTAPPVVRSPIFHVGGHAWRLHVKPHGPASPAVYIVLVDHTQAAGVTASVRVAVVHPTKPTHDAYVLCITNQEFTREKPKWGTARASVRQDYLAKLVVNDTLRFTVDIVC